MLCLRNGNIGCRHCYALLCYKDGEEARCESEHWRHHSHGRHAADMAGALPRAVYNNCFGISESQISTAATPISRKEKQVLRLAACRATSGGPLHKAALAAAVAGAGARFDRGAG